MAGFGKGSKQQIVPPPVPFVVVTNIKNKGLTQKQEKKRNAFAFWNSFVLHTIILLIMALTILPAQIKEKPIVLSLSFSAPNNEENDIFIGDIETLPSEAGQSSLIEEVSQQQQEMPIEIPDLPQIKIEELVVESEVKVEPPVEQKVSMSTSIVEADRVSLTKEIVSNNISTNLPDKAGLSSTGNQRGNNGVGKEMERRLGNAGAKTGDVQISISWETIDDIDLHVRYVNKNNLFFDYICWENKCGEMSGGILDVDMNARPENVTNQPVENVFWPEGSSPRGFFEVGIHYYWSWSGAKSVPVEIRIVSKGKTKFIKRNAILGKSVQSVHKFTF